MSETSRLSLLTAAREVYFQHGIKSVSMDDIAKFLGISKKTIYNLISNKNGLVHAVVSSFIEEEEEYYQGISANSTNAVDELISIARHALSTLKSIKPTLTHDLKKYHALTWALIETDHFEFVEQSVLLNLKRGIEEGYYRSNLNLDVIPKLYLSQLRMVTNNETFDDKAITQADIYNTIILYHLNGITNDKGRIELEKHLNKEVL